MIDTTLVTTEKFGASTGRIWAVTVLTVKGSISHHNRLAPISYGKVQEMSLEGVISTATNIFAHHGRQACHTLGSFCSMVGYGGGI